MKRISYLLIVAIVLIGSACGSKGKSKENVKVLEVSEIDTTLKKTTIEFVETTHDFGKVKEGEKVVHVYEFKNTGDADLLLQKVRASCGCTTPKYDKQPVRPGKIGHIEVAFNTKGRPGMQRKNVTVTTNTEPPATVLSFTCEVIPSEEKTTQNTNK